MGVIYTIFIICFCFGLSYIAYTIVRKIQSEVGADFIPNNEFSKKGVDSPDVLMFFFANWCPHSQKSKKIWEQIQNDSNFKTFGLKFVSIDGEDKDKRPLLEEYDIKEFPSIVLIKDNKKYIYDANLISETLMKFLTTVYRS